LHLLLKNLTGKGLKSQIFITAGQRPADRQNTKICPKGQDVRGRDSFTDTEMR